MVNVCEIQAVIPAHPLFSELDNPYQNDFLRTCFIWKYTRMVTFMENFTGGFPIFKFNI